MKLKIALTINNETPTNTAHPPPEAKATLRGKLKDGTQFTCIVRATWHGEYGEGRLRTGELIKLWRGPLKTFLQHPAMMLLEHNNEIQNQP